MKLEVTDKRTAKCDLARLDLSWESNPAAQRLIDVIVHILANEYVRTVKENPTLFSDKGDSK